MVCVCVICEHDIAAWRHTNSNGRSTTHWQRNYMFCLRSKVIRRHCVHINMAAIAFSLHFITIELKC